MNESIRGTGRMNVTAAGAKPFWIHREATIADHHRLRVFSQRGEDVSDLDSEYESARMFDFLCKKHDLVRLSQRIAVNPQVVESVFYDRNDISASLSDGTLVTARMALVGKPESILKKRLQQLMQDSQKADSKWLGVKNGTQHLLLRRDTLASCKIDGPYFVLINRNQKTVKLDCEYTDNARALLAALKQVVRG